MYISVVLWSNLHVVYLFTYLKINLIICIINVGEIGITLSVGWAEPRDPFSQDDIRASEQAMLWDFGIWAHPVVFGDYPDIVKSRVGNNSLHQNFTKSRLPEFTDEEKHMIKSIVYCFCMTVHSM
jgi:beta-glucosidase/6-phospho-beta-glucosidase/beta-galactosidase